MRVIWHNRNQCHTSQLDQNYELDHFIHSAPISLWDMADAFTNKHIGDYSEREISVWKDLDQKGGQR